jgi:heme/copper-type cytochrome/quinol oxidase subunit 2
MPLSLRQILLGRNCKILDAFCSITMAGAMQFLIFCTYLRVRREIQQNPELAHHSYKFIFKGMVMMCAICLSFIFFVLALVKYREANKNKEASQHKYITLSTKVLLLTVSIPLAVEICSIAYNSVSLHFGPPANYVSRLHTWFINILRTL